MFADQEVWVDAAGIADSNRTSVQDQLGSIKVLLVPVTHLRAADAPSDGPQAAGVWDWVGGRGQA